MDVVAVKGSNLEPRFVAPAGDAKAIAPSTSAFAGFKLSLRKKGILAFAVLVVYVAGIALFVAHDRQVLLHIVQQLEYVHEEQQALIKINTLVAHCVVEAQHALTSGNFGAAYEDFRLDLAAAQAGLPQLQAGHPELAPGIIRFERRAADLAHNWSVANLREVRDSAQELSAQVESIEAIIGHDGELLSQEYRQVNQKITNIAMMLSLSGVVLFGALVTKFFSRLAADIHRLEARASEIVGGYRGKSLEVTRRDELGGLTAALNHIQSELVQSEQKKLISWQQRFHRERMAAVGSLAAAVAHEISNPLSAISGVAQLQIEHLRSHDRPDDETLCHNAGLVVEQVERIASIVRQLADLGATHEMEAKLVDVNEVVQSTCNLVRFDRRFRDIEIALELAPASSLPAALAVADHMTQVLMNLLINAADAMDGLSGRPRTIRVLTRCLDRAIVLSVIDNGHGMDPQVLARAFDESFSTKPIGKGRGIGLYLCKMLIEAMDGRIELESTVGVGTSAHVYLPLPTAVAAAV